MYIFRLISPDAYQNWTGRQKSPVATGGFGGLSPPNKAPSPSQIEIWNSINQWFSSIFRMSSLPAQTRNPPIEDFLATVLPQNQSRCYCLMPLGRFYDQIHGRYLVRRSQLRRLSFFLLRCSKKVISQSNPKRTTYSEKLSIQCILALAWLSQKSSVCTTSIRPKLQGKQQEY